MARPTATRTPYTRKQSPDSKEADEKNGRLCEFSGDEINTRAFEI
jgi:hypothetical protein